MWVLGVRFLARAAMHLTATSSLQPLIIIIIISSSSSIYLDKASHVAQIGLELLIPTCLTPNCWDCKVLGLCTCIMECLAWCLLAKHSTNWAPSSTLDYNFQRVGRKLGDSHIDNNKTRAIFFLLLVTVQQCCCVWGEKNTGAFFQSTLVFWLPGCVD